MSNYFEFLKSKVNLNDSFDDILIALYDSPFISYIDKDNARVSDGLRLRNEYYGPEKANKLSHIPCNTLELLVALAIRMENEYVGDPKSYEIRETFLKLIDNLGLLKHYNKGKMKLIIKNFIERNYASNGSGGLFPLKRTIRDQRSVDLWSQMMEWISENYVF